MSRSIVLCPNDCSRQQVLLLQLSGQVSACVGVTSCDVSLHRFNESERLLKEQQAAHASLTKHNDSLRRNYEALQLQHDK